MSDTYAVPNKLPGKQVNILAQRRKRILQQKSVVNQRRQQRIQRFAKKKRTFKRAEAFIMEYIKAEKSQNRIKREILKNILKTEKTNQELLVVLRHAGKNIADVTTNKVLEALRLTKIHQTVFLKNNKENQVLLKVIEPFVVYGYPTITTIRELIFKKGFAIVDGIKTAIQSNTMIEEQLGKEGIICVEDIIHEIFTVGPKFDVVSNFICPFTLRSPKDGWKKKISVSFARGGEYGNRKDAVNSAIERCL